MCRCMDISLDLNKQAESHCCTCVCVCVLYTCIDLWPFRRLQYQARWTNERHETGCLYRQHCLSGSDRSSVPLDITNGAQAGTRRRRVVITRTGVEYRRTLLILADEREPVVSVTGREQCRWLDHKKHSFVFSLKFLV